jgi:hypothetical protein
MNGFEPTILGVAVYIITIAEINAVLQGLLIVATLIYTIIKIVQLLDNGKD